ncbi:MAG TPA: dienelactone hydrolase family protein [Candidatus Aquilonibacter sp.]|nr:dienelactone hydrolase family protein [Candidatus Aquilonibacter sp.]
MSEWVKVTASDGFVLSAYVARPQDDPKGAIVVIQEIFGVNKSIQAVADSYASDGFLAIAPAIMDRIEPGLNLGYGEADLKKAFSLYPKLNPDDSLKDVAAAFKYAREIIDSVGVLGFCYGGLVSWVAAVRGNNEAIEPACTVCYYPGGIGKFAAEEPSCPVMIHFGGADDHIGNDQVDAVRNAHGKHPGEVEIFVYEGAPHAFANPDRPSYKAEAAKLARERSLKFLNTHIA